MKDRIVKYVGISTVINEKAELSHGFHTSNNFKYAVWANMPSEADGIGHSISFHWFKLPEAMAKLDAVKHLLQLPQVHFNDAQKELLNGILAKAAPKAPKERKAKKAKTVTVEVTPKTVNQADADAMKAATLAKIKDAAQKRKANAA